MRGWGTCFPVPDGAGGLGAVRVVEFFAPHEVVRGVAGLGEGERGDGGSQSEDEKWKDRSHGARLCRGMKRER